MWTTFRGCPLFRLERTNWKFLNPCIWWNLVESLGSSSFCRDPTEYIPNPNRIKALMVSSHSIWFATWVDWVLTIMHRSPQPNILNKWKAPMVWVSCWKLWKRKTESNKGNFKILAKWHSSLTFNVPRLRVVVHDLNRAVNTLYLI